MSKTWYTSDLHFYHTNICLHTDRKKVVHQEDHDIWLIDLWNLQVNKSDTVWHLGDTAFTKERLTDIATWVGHKTAILGNHCLEKEYTIRDYVEAFDDVQGFMKYKEFWLSHAPIHPDELRGKVNIHGHVHNETIKDTRYFNTSLENIGYRPISLQQIRNILYNE